MADIHDKVQALFEAKEAERMAEKAAKDITRTGSNSDIEMLKDQVDIWKKLTEKVEKAQKAVDDDPQKGTAKSHIALREHKFKNPKPLLPKLQDVAKKYLETATAYQNMLNSSYTPIPSDIDYAKRQYEHGKAEFEMLKTEYLTLQNLQKEAQKENPVVLTPAQQKVAQAAVQAAQKKGQKPPQGSSETIKIKEIEDQVQPIEKKIDAAEQRRAQEDRAYKDARAKAKADARAVPFATIDIPIAKQVEDDIPIAKQVEDKEIPEALSADVADALDLLDDENDEIDLGELGLNIDADEIDLNDEIDLGELGLNIDANDNALDKLSSLLAYDPPKQTNAEQDALSSKPKTLVLSGSAVKPLAVNAKMAQNQAAQKAVDRAPPKGKVFRHS